MASLQHLGQVGNKLLVFGGVYSNLQALEALYATASAKGYTPEQIICTGDIVGYCAQPEEVVQFVKKWGIHCIAGNVELQLAAGEEDCGCDFDSGSRCDVFSRQWYPYAQKQLSSSALDYVKTLPEHLSFEMGDLKGYVLHGSYFHTSDFIFKSTPWTEKAKNFEAVQKDFILAGHCGLPFYDFNHEKHWVNAGVIGMPANDGQTAVWYCTIEQKATLEVNFHQLEYDYATAAQLMRIAQLPLSYAQTLEDGIWDNCDILPEEETKRQGRPVSL